MEHSNNVYLLELIVKWKKHLIVIAALSAVISGLLSGPFFITPKYKSNAVVYPVNLVPYGNESVAEQLLQLLNSSEIRNAVIREFRLWERYDVPYPVDTPGIKLIREFNDHVSISKTEFESIEIVVLDKNPAVACEMVKTIIRETNLLARRIHRDKSVEMLKMYEDQERFTVTQIDSIDARLTKLRMDFGIINAEEQLQEVTRGYMTMLNNGKSINEINRIQQGFIKHGGELKFLNGKIEVALEYLEKVNKGINDVKSDLSKELTYISEVTKPYPADSKSYPVRWIIVVISMVASIALALFIILLTDKTFSAKK
jgi:capsular polysaccharide biosynthesis protein